MESPREGHVIVCGLGRFGLRIVELLRGEEMPVVVITDAATRSDRKKRVLDLGAFVVEGDFRYGETLHAAGVERARTLVLAASDAEANLETALDVRRAVPLVRIVMRFDAPPRLAERLHHDFAIDAVLSPSVLAAQEFVRAALDRPPAHARAERPVPSRKPSPAPPATPHLRPEARFMAASFLVLFALGVVIFRRELRIPLADAIYFTSTIMATVGFGDYHLREEAPGVKLFGALLMFSGITLIAMLSSFLTHYLLSGSMERLRAERVARGCRDHVIVCGLGSVGYEVAQDLRARRIRVVVVDATPGDEYFNALAARIPVLVGDATRPDVLLRAGIDRARAVIAATSDDAINLEIGLTAQSVVEERRPDRPVRLVLRCFDPDLAARIHAVSDAYTLLSATSISAPIFAAHAMAPGTATARG